MWFNVLWKSTRPDSAEYYAVVVKTDSGKAMTIRYRSGITELTGRYADDSMRIKSGVWNVYSEKGTLTHSSIFINGKAQGPEAFYDDRGRVEEKGENRDGERTGTWTGYYPSGKSAGTAVYNAGKLVSLALLNEDGTPNREDKVFEREAEFPGGAKELLKYFNKNMKYPDYAVDHSIQGVVMVKFRVTKEGQIMDVKVQYTANKHLDAAALELVRGMPEWKPAVVGGVARDCWKVQPVDFRL